MLPRTQSRLARIFGPGGMKSHLLQTRCRGLSSIDVTLRRPAVMRRRVLEVVAPDAGNDVGVCDLNSDATGACLGSNLLSRTYRDSFGGRAIARTRKPGICAEFGVNFHGN